MSDHVTDALAKMTRERNAALVARNQQHDLLVEAEAEIARLTELADKYKWLNQETAKRDDDGASDV